MAQLRRSSRLSKNKQPSVTAANSVSQEPYYNLDNASTKPSDLGNEEDDSSSDESDSSFNLVDVQNGPVTHNVLDLSIRQTTSVHSDKSGSDQNSSDVMAMLLQCENIEFQKCVQDVNDTFESDPEIVVSKKSTRKGKERKRKFTDNSEDDFVISNKKIKNNHTVTKSNTSKRKRTDSDQSNAESHNPKKPKKEELTEEQKEIRRFTNRCLKDRASCLEQCTLVMDIAFVRNMMKASTNSLIQAQFMSVLPNGLVSDSPDSQCTTILELIDNALLWYHSQFTLQSSNIALQKSEKKSPQILCMELLACRSTIYQHIYVLGFCIILHVLGLDVRLVASFFNTPTLDKIKPRFRLSPKMRIKSLLDDQKLSCIELVEDVSFWLEMKNVGTITSIDVCNGIIDNDLLIENNLTQPPGYIISLTSDLDVLDSTPKYSVKWACIHRKARSLNLDYWTVLIDNILQTSRVVLIEHKTIMKKIMVDRGFPLSLGGFKHNLVFVLEKDLLKFEAIYPCDANVLGMFKSHKVYSRDNVKTLKQLIVIKKEGRAVKEGEVPYKMVKQKIYYDRWPGDDRWKDLPLWGEWQTEWYNAPTAHDGIVPRNEFGNVELFKPWMLPIGTEHVDLPGSYALGRRLGIDVAHAVKGFEFPKGRAVPVMTGVVVCTEKAELLRNAWVEYSAVQAQKAEDKRVKRIYDNWRLMIRCVLIKERVSRRFESMSDKGRSTRGHIHKFPKKSQRKDKITGQLVQKCACGLVVLVESWEDEL